MANVIVVSETPQRVIIRDEAATRTVKVVAQGPQGPSGNVNPLMFQLLDQATSAATSASADAAAAQSSSASAFASANAAGASAASVSASELAAEGSAVQAAASASQAAASATSVAASVTSAQASATSAANSATSAQTSANAVIDKANIADAAAASAELSAATATTKATEAATSATNAANSATSASTSATTATTKATQASTSATLAQDWAIKTVGPVSGAEYSSKYHAQAASASAGSASSSATDAAASATTAGTKAGEASASAASALDSEDVASVAAQFAVNAQSAAQTSANAALASKNAAATSATSASDSATAASNSATAAAGSATSAGNSATGASSSAVAAAGSATTASNSATSASNSASAASTSAANSATSAAQALQAKNDAVAALASKLDAAAAQFGGNAATASKLLTARTISVTGDLTWSTSFDGSGNVTAAGTLANSGVTAGTYGSATQVQPFTVDAKGRLTSVGAAVTITPAWGSITSKPTTLAGYGIADAIPMSALGASNGVASLDANGLIPPTQLPSYVDDVLEFADLAAFPAVGDQGKIYVALDTNKTYRWSGSVYIHITSGAAVDSVAGKTGVVTLVKGDVGLGSVDNTSDASKPVSTAQQAALNLKANLASPVLTGIPQAPTAAPGTNTTQIATTAHVFAATSSVLAGISAKADIDSPSFTGIPLVPTAAIGNNTTQASSTAFVLANAVQKDGPTGAAMLPTGTSAQRPVSGVGKLRFNSDTQRFEGNNGVAWGSLGGATGGGNDDAFYENTNTITSDYAITVGKNAMSAGPITVADGATITIPDGSVWTVV